MRNLPIAVVVCLGVGLVQAVAGSAEDVLSKMDQAAPSFTGMTAELKKLTYTKVIDDKGEESGTFQLRKAKGGLQVLIDFTKPDPRVISFQGKKAEIYYPKINTLQEYDLAKKPDLVEQFLLVGFGTTGKELAANYAVKWIGEETAAGQKTMHLELVPKLAARREKLQKLDLWMAENGAYPVQQRFNEPSGNYTQFTYSGIKLNPPLTEAAMQIKVPKNVKREKPLK